jgi:hypothetical protein
MTRTQISAWIMLVFCGLWSGGILIFAVERTNLWRRMPLEQYVVDFRRSLFRADPMMPILGVTAGAGATFFALNRSGAATVFAWAGIGFIVLVVVASITIAERSTRNFVGCLKARCRNGLNTIGPFGGAFTRREISRPLQRSPAWRPRP